MTDQETVHARKRRGPKPTGKGRPVQVRLLPDLLGRLDAWIGTLPEPKPTRAEAIRMLIRERFAGNND
jgi:hypothetical protein